MNDKKKGNPLKRAMRKLIPKSLRDKLRPYSKTVAAVLIGAPQVVNATVPEYSDETKLIVSALLWLMTAAGVYQFKNEE